MLFIDGKWRTGAGDEFTSHSPASGEVVWSGRAASAADVGDAVFTATQAQRHWQRMPFPERTQILRTFADKLREQHEQFAQLISMETGKPHWDARTEVDAMIAKVDVSLTALAERRAETERALPQGTAHTRYRPHGVVAVFGPFNFPGHLANGQIVPALAAGNAVLFKPSELTPRVAEETVKLWEAAGLPAGVLNLLQGGRSTGEAIIQQAQQGRIQAVLFTGSLATGLSLRRALIDRPDVLLALELGGNNPLIVHRPSDISAAVALTLQSAFITSGQRCTCARRLIVTPGNDEFLTKLQRAVERVVVGAPEALPEPFMGPLIHARAASQVLAAQQALIDAGGIPLVACQTRSDLGPAFLSPGLIDVSHCQNVPDEEIFGPLLQVIYVESLAEAITVANQTQYGLVAGILTDSAADFAEFEQQSTAGLVNWNRPTTGASGWLPFGGTGFSGNHRPAGYFMVDACNIPVASMRSANMERGPLPPGVDLS